MRMGRRSRARQRAAASAAEPARGGASADPGRQAGAERRPAATGAAPAGRRRRLLGLLNPFKFRRLTSSRARQGAIGFGLSAVLFAVLGWVTGQAAWFSSAVLLAILALAWGATAALMGRLDRSG
jgi:hypothetical protein